MEINSYHLKTAVMAYYRFKNQSLCVDELYLGHHIADVLVDTTQEIIEVECKTSKSDLWADKNKEKHENYKNTDRFPCPNKFYICVPSNLLEEANKFIKEINNSYGIMEFSEERFKQFKNYERDWNKIIKINKRAKSLRNFYMSKTYPISSRLCSALINEYIRNFTHEK